MPVSKTSAIKYKVLYSFRNLAEKRQTERENYYRLRSHDMKIVLLNLLHNYNVVDQLNLFFSNLNDFVYRLIVK